jgi:type II secretory pathway pseudopilin PulG
MKRGRWTRRAARRQLGISITELVAVIAVSGLLMIVGVPSLNDAKRCAAMTRSIAQVHGLLVRCRAVAVLRSRPCAVVFDRQVDGSWSCFVAEDGDGDGVRRVDISSGTDPVVDTAIVIDTHGAGPGILGDGSVPDPSGSGRLGGDLGDPIRAGRGNIITFSQNGTATPSSVYFTDNSRRMVVLRIYGGTGRINRLRWQRGWSQWKQG